MTILRVIMEKMSNDISRMRDLRDCMNRPEYQGTPNIDELQGRADEMIERLEVIYGALKELEDLS